LSTNDIEKVAKNYLPNLPLVLTTAEYL